MTIHGCLCRIIHFVALHGRKDTEEELVPQAWEVGNGLSSRADLAVALVALSVSHRRESRLVDSAREKNKARAVVERSAFI